MAATEGRADDFMAGYRRFMDLYVEARIKAQEARIEERQVYKELWLIEAPIIVDKGRDQDKNYLTALSLVETKGNLEHQKTLERHERAVQAVYDAETELELFGLALQAWTHGPYDERLRAAGPLIYLRAGKEEE